MKTNKISELEYYPIRPSNGHIGFVSFVYDDALSCNSVAVYTKLNGDGIRCVFPAVTAKNGRKTNIFFPINKETTTMITDKIEEKINDLTEDSSITYDA